MYWRGENAYSDYFKYVQFALGNLIESFENYKTDNSYELGIIKAFSQKFLNTIECFSLKYAFNENQPMLIDLTDSGFPNHLEFRRLEDDLKKKKVEINKGQSEIALKHTILDHMIKNKSEPGFLLKQLAMKSYFERISKHKLFREFTEGDLVKLTPDNESKSKRYLYSWGSFDSVTNRPYIYILVFDVVKVRKGDAINPGEVHFVENIRKITHNTAPLKVMAADLDELYNSVKPQVLKRINLGPIYGMYSRDNSIYTEMLNQKFDHRDFIFNYETEIIFSVGEKRNKSFLSTGELRQIFYVDESNKDTMERMISQLNKYMITSHGVLQYLNEYHKDILENLSSKPYIYAKD